MSAEPGCVQLAATPTELVAQMNDGTIHALDLATGELHTIPVLGLTPNCFAVTNAHVLIYSTWWTYVQLMNRQSGVLQKIALPSGLRVTFMCADTDSDGFLIFGYSLSAHQHGLAYVLGLNGVLRPLTRANQLFWAEYCRILPGRTALLNYGKLVAVDLNTGDARELTLAERALPRPSPDAPVFYGRRYTRSSFPAMEREFAPVEPYSRTEHLLFGPQARAAVLTILLMMHLGQAPRLNACLLDRLLAAVVRWVAPPAPQRTYAQPW